MSTNTAPTYACPACGNSDSLGTLEENVAFSNLDEYGEFTGTTDYEDDLTTVGIACYAYFSAERRSCGWEAKVSSREEGLALLTKIAPLPPPLRVSLNGGLDKRRKA